MKVGKDAIKREISNYNEKGDTKTAKMIDLLLHLCPGGETFDGVDVNAITDLGMLSSAEGAFIDAVISRQITYFAEKLYSSNGVIDTMNTVISAVKPVRDYLEQFGWNIYKDDVNKFIKFVSLLLQKYNKNVKDMTLRKFFAQYGNQQPMTKSQISGLSQLMSPEILAVMNSVKDDISKMLSYGFDTFSDVVNKLDSKYNIISDETKTGLHEINEAMNELNVLQAGGVLGTDVFNVPFTQQSNDVMAKGIEEK